jgi:hypothetical protein
LAARLNVNVIGQVSVTDVTAPDLGLTPLQEMPRVPNRDFKATVTSKQLHVTWDLKEGDVVVHESMGITQQRAALRKYHKKIKTWRITVQDMADSALRPLRLFPEISLWRANNTKASLRGLCYRAVHWMRIFVPPKPTLRRSVTT